ncbi:MAG: hypothetical protein HOI88_06640 [Phycisphaerae bacterium]|jgi:hypothetical protein|nr:hypothetical protein [Phycisphaerae bacterium]MBT5135949.1 hypothetical protein [Phycisphaerae bacterium]MBT6270010.1 hypothetical protein [Phycisphaerae bacterium]MBT6281835.1 hypothetical protein [Phycisphaerae bacterium]
MKLLALLSLLFVFCSAATSCNIASVVTYVASPDPSKEAVFVLPNVATVVFVDDRKNVMHPTRLRRVVAERITKDLLEKDILTTMISPRDILRVSSSSDRYGEPVPMDQLGKSVDASVLIYVEIVGFSLTSDGQTAKPVANCSVKVIDVRNRQRLFPLDDMPYFVRANVTNIAPSRLSGSGEVRKLSEELAETLGDEVAKLFYEHITGRLGENLKRQ